MMAMEKKDKNLNVPNLRFPEFSGEWKETTIGECSSDLEYGMNAPSKYFDGVNKYIRITDIDEQTSEYKQDSVVSPDAPLEDKYIVKDRDILFARTGASTGKTYIYNPQDGKMYYAGFLIRANVKIEDNPKFVFYQTQTHRYKKWVSIMSMRSGQPGINSQEYASYKFWKPCKDEQDKISALISLLDTRIQTQKKIIEKYESLIRGLCEKLTRQGDANKSINECLECHSSTLQESEVLDTGRYPVYGAIGVCGYTDTPDVSGEGILIIKDGASVGVTYFADGCYSSIGTLNRLTAKQGLNLRYVYYCLKVMNFAPYKTGLAIPHIYFKDYGKHKIWCPSFEQQSRIADVLINIDNNIHVEKLLLEQLNSQKQYMLNQLFI